MTTAPCPPAEENLLGPLASFRSRHPVLCRQLGRYTIVGAICTATFSLVYLLLSHPLGDTFANTIALVLAAVLNTALNRRHTFEVAGRDGVLRHHGQGIIILALTWVLTTAALTGLRIIAPAATSLTVLAVLTLANLCGTGLRFLLFRTWVFRR